MIFKRIIIIIAVAVRRIQERRHHHCPRNNHRTMTNYLSMQVTQEDLFFAERTTSGEDGDTTTSASNSVSCPHAFHTSCIIEYANTKVQSSTLGWNVVPCPLCRQPFYHKRTAKENK
mmetsp:Transcript_9633/g.26653  ORF Transcript_9633/g.26653 Transcript_9633/m.26653 type:complete len:117 (-) Transcript_9633:2623-2973(-)